jgi:hypothetical protein
MPDLTRRRALTLGAALGLVGATAAAPKAWAWSSKGSIAATDTTTDPFTVWDTAADPVAASLLSNGQVAAVNTAFQSWIHNSDPLPSGIPAGLTTYLEQVNTLPSWANPTLLAQADAFNQTVNTFLFVSYGLGSGMLSTVIPAEAINVYYSAGGADMKARAAKTFTFGYDLTAPGAYTPSGNFIVTANKTRLVHATVRSLLPTDSEWVSATVESTPISNGDILRTFASVGTFAYSNLTKWGIPISASDAAAWMHSWQVALALLGVEEQFIPQTWADAQAQAAQILTPVIAPTSQGLYLAQTLLGYIETPIAGVDTGFISEFVRYLVGDQVADWLQLPVDLISRAIIDVAWPLFVLFDTGLSAVAPEGADVFSSLLKGVSLLFLDNGTSATYVPITIPAANNPNT